MVCVSSVGFFASLKLSRVCGRYAAAPGWLRDLGIRFPAPTGRRRHGLEAAHCLNELRPSEAVSVWFRRSGERVMYKVKLVAIVGVPGESNGGMMT